MCAISVCNPMYTEYTPGSASSLRANISDSSAFNLFLDVEIVTRWRVTRLGRIAAKPSGGAERDGECFFVMMLNAITMQYPAELHLRPR